MDRLCVLSRFSCIQLHEPESLQGILQQQQCPQHRSGISLIIEHTCNSKCGCSKNHNVNYSAGSTQFFHCSDTLLIVVYSFRKSSTTRFVPSKQNITQESQLIDSRRHNHVFSTSNPGTMNMVTVLCVQRERETRQTWGSIRHKACLQSIGAGILIFRASGSVRCFRLFAAFRNGERR